MLFTPKATCTHSSGHVDSVGTYGVHSPPISSARKRIRGARNKSIDTTILFISRDACSDSIAKLFRVFFLMGYRTIIAR